MSFESNVTIASFLPGWRTVSNTNLCTYYNSEEFEPILDAQVVGAAGVISRSMGQLPCESWRKLGVPPSQNTAAPWEQRGLFLGLKFCVPKTWFISDAHGARKSFSRFEPPHRPLCQVRFISAKSQRFATMALLRASKSPHMFVQSVRLLKACGSMAYTMCISSKRIVRVGFATFRNGRSLYRSLISSRRSGCNLTAEYVRRIYHHWDNPHIDFKI